MKHLGLLDRMDRLSRKLCKGHMQAQAARADAESVRERSAAKALATAFSDAITELNEMRRSVERFDDPTPT